MYGQTGTSRGGTPVKIDLLRATTGTNRNVQEMNTCRDKFIKEQAGTNRNVQGRNTCRDRFIKEQAGTNRNVQGRNT